MLVLDVSFSVVWIGLLVVQASTFFVQDLRVFYLHRLVLGPLGAVFYASYGPPKLIESREIVGFPPRTHPTLGQ
jgi:hypothetical protein